MDNQAHLASRRGVVVSYLAGRSFSCWFRWHCAGLAQERGIAARRYRHVASLRRHFALAVLGAGALLAGAILLAVVAHIITD